MAIKSQPLLVDAVVSTLEDLRMSVALPRYLAVDGPGFPLPDKRRKSLTN